jgi:hypothetical protein
MKGWQRELSVPSTAAHKWFGINEIISLFFKFLKNYLLLYGQTLIPIKLNSEVFDALNFTPTNPSS